MAEVYKSRGLDHYGDINHNQFPGKWERTEMFEDPAQTDDFMRNTLRDFSPEVAAHASDFARRGYQSGGRLSLFHTGTRSGISPENPDLFLGFTDRDPRGHLLEPNGDEWKRQSWHRKKMFQPQFRDDSDWSVPSQGVHPNTKYAQIRATQPWLKARFRNFETSRTGWHNGGIIEIPHASLVDKSCAQTEKMDCRLIDTELKARQHKTSLLSNNFQMGWRSRPGHRFKVAQYGKLYKSTPHMNHVSQIDYISEDRKLSDFVLENPLNAPKSTIILMSAATSKSAASEAQKMRHLKGEEMAKHLAGISGEPALEATIRGLRLSDDIMRILGYVENSDKFGQSKARQKLGKGLNPSDDPEKIRQLAELLHKEPANIQLQLNKIIHGSGLHPTKDRFKNAQNTIVNPKIIGFMSNNTRSAPDPEINGENRNKRLAESSEKEKLEKMPMYVPKRRKDTKITEMLHNGDINKNHRENTNELGIKSYKSLKEKAIAKNRELAQSTQLFNDTSRNMLYKTNNTLNKVADTNSTEQDIGGREHMPFTRHGGKMGGKYTRREMDTDTYRCGMDNI